MSELKLQVCLLAENRLFREALSRILGKQCGIRIASSSPFSADLLKPIAELNPDLLLCDASVLSSDGFLPKLRVQLPALKVVMIGMDASPDLFLHSVRQGAVGYVLKDASAAELAMAVRTVVNNKAFCHQSLLLPLFEAVARPLSADPSARVKRELGLSRREQQLTRMIGEGLTNKEIASQLNLSEQTVKNHVHRMLRKVGAKDRLMIVERWREVRRAEYGTPVQHP